MNRVICCRVPAVFSCGPLIQKCAFPGRHGMGIAEDGGNYPTLFLLSLGLFGFQNTDTAAVCSIFYYVWRPSDVNCQKATSEGL